MARNDSDAVSDLAVRMMNEYFGISSSNPLQVKDYVGGIVESSTTPEVDFNSQTGLLEFSTIVLDLHNISNAIKDEANFVSPDITVQLSNNVKANATIIPISMSIIDSKDEFAEQQSAQERKITADFNLVMEGDGASSALQAPSEISISYSAGDGASIATLTLTNDDEDILGLIGNQSNEAPTSLTLKVVNLISKAAAAAPELDFSSILGEGGNFYLEMSGLPLTMNGDDVTKLSGTLSIVDLVDNIDVPQGDDAVVTVTDYLDGVSQKPMFRYQFDGNILDLGSMDFDVAYKMEYQTKQISHRPN